MSQDLISAIEYSINWRGLKGERVRIISDIALLINKYEKNLKKTLSYSEILTIIYHHTLQIGDQKEKSLIMLV